MRWDRCLPALYSSLVDSHKHLSCDTNILCPITVQLLISPSLRRATKLSHVQLIERKILKKQQQLRLKPVHCKRVRLLALFTIKRDKPQSRSTIVAWHSMCCAATWCLSERGYHVAQYNANRRSSTQLRKGCGDRRVSIVWVSECQRSCDHRSPSIDSAAHIAIQPSLLLLPLPFLVLPLSPLA